MLVERKGDDVVSMHDGQRIEFRIEGESDYETGTVVKAKKEWVRRDSDGSITGEGWINSWNPLDEPDDPTWLTKDDIELQAALDSISINGDTANAERFKWLIDNCTKEIMVHGVGGYKPEYYISFEAIKGKSIVEMIDYLMGKLETDQNVEQYLANKKLFGR